MRCCTPAGKTSAWLSSFLGTSEPFLFLSGQNRKKKHLRDFYVTRDLLAYLEQQVLAVLSMRV